MTYTNISFAIPYIQAQETILVPINNWDEGSGE